MASKYGIILMMKVGSVMKILNVGSLNIDYTYQVERIVKPGETISSQELNVFAGGKGLNQSIALARAGAKVYHAGMVGDDGVFLIDICRNSGVNTDYIKIGSIRTGNAIIQVTLQGQNSIILFPGANRSLSKEYLDQVLDHFEKGDILLLQNEVNLVDYLIEAAAKRGMKIFLNPSPYNKYLDNCDLSKVDTFLMNEVEGYQITKKHQPIEILEAMKQKYNHARVVLTLGKEGVYYQDRDEQIYYQAHTVEAVDTTGAGDTFTGYYIASIMEGKSNQEALVLATAASALAVMKPGAANAIPGRNEVEDFKNNL